jgi:threonyl-tRNA synthetase
MECLCLLSSAQFLIESLATYRFSYERSGTLHGLMRVRGFTQDDAHIYCLPDQLQDEIVQVLDLTQKILSHFGFEKYDIMLSTRPEKYVGSDDIWEAATAALEGALKAKGWDYTIDEVVEHSMVQRLI